MAGKIFTTLTVGGALFAIGWGFSVAGILGSLTGLAATFAIGIPVSIAIGTLAAVDEPGAARKHFAQIWGGLIAAIGAGFGVYYGGWRMGWLYAIGGYLLGILVTIVVGLLSRRGQTKSGHK